MREASVCLLSTLMAATAACHSAPVLPSASGRGLVAFDPEPPAGAQLWQRPEVHLGDTFTLRRGGQTRQRFTVVEASADASAVADEEGHRLRRSADLGNLGEWNATGDTPVHLLSPVDVRYHWPLWVGKKWRCEFADVTAGAQPMSIVADYCVEGMDTIVVPAGTFSALRIVRRTVPNSNGERYLDRTSITWYAPSIGIEVRQLIDNTTYELVDWQSGKKP